MKFNLKKIEEYQAYLNKFGTELNLFLRNSQKLNNYSYIENYYIKNNTLYVNIHDWAIDDDETIELDLDLIKMYFEDR